MSWVADASDEEASHGDEDHGLGDVEAAVVCAIGEEMLDPRPALADGIEDRLRAGAVGDVGGRQIDHQAVSYTHLTLPTILLV